MSSPAHQQHHTTSVGGGGGGGSAPHHHQPPPSSHHHHHPTPPSSSHPLSLRVMRLKRPDMLPLRERPPILLEPHDQAFTGDRSLLSSLAPPPSIQGIDTTTTTTCSSSSDDDDDDIGTRRTRDTQETTSDVERYGLALSNALSLPGSFGTICVGETFTGYISLHCTAGDGSGVGHTHHDGDDMAVVVSNVTLRCELFTGNVRRVLLDTASSGSSSSGSGSSGGGGGGGIVMRPGQNVDHIVEFVLSEAGAHILVCTVTYESSSSTHQQQYITTTTTTTTTSSTSSSMDANSATAAPSLQTTQQQHSFRKIFKFPVSQPLVVRSVRVNTLPTPSYPQPVIVQLDLQNALNTPLHVESVRLDPSAGYTLESLQRHSGSNNSNSSKEGEDGGNMDSHPMMQRGECRRFLFRLTQVASGATTAVAHAPQQSAAAAADSTTGTISTPPVPPVLGQLELQWRTAMGDTGTLVTNAIPHKPAARPDIDMEPLAIVGGSNEGAVGAVCGRPFSLRCRVVNRSREDVDLSVHFDIERMHPIACSGCSVLPVGLVRAMSGIEVHLPLMPLQSGVHPLGRGITLRDAVSGRAFPLGHVCDINVQ